MQDWPSGRGQVWGPHIPLHPGETGLCAHPRGCEESAGQLDTPRPTQEGIPQIILISQLNFILFLMMFSDRKAHLFEFKRN